jgi:hypothetical protein
MIHFFGDPDWWRYGKNQDRYNNGKWLKKRK